MVAYKVDLARIDISKKELEAVNRVLKSNWLSLGKENQLFEEEFAAYINKKYAIAVSSCTSALHLALLALNLKKDDEVIVPTYTFAATAHAVCYVGAKPVFMDIAAKDDFNINADQIENLVTPKTKAIIVVHFAGFPVDMDKVQLIAKKYDLAVIEDCAHAIGGEYRGKKLGSLSDISCFSFFANKNLVTGEGGMILTDDENFANRIRRLRTHGIVRGVEQRKNGFDYDLVELGYNYKLTEIQAAIGRCQLEKVDRNQERRQWVRDIYEDKLHTVQGVSIPFKSHKCKSGLHVLPIVVDKNIDRKDLRNRLSADGISTTIHYKPVHELSYYKAMGNYSLPIAEEISKREITLPFYPMMSEKEIDYVVNSLRKNIKNMKAKKNEISVLPNMWRKV